MKRINQFLLALIVAASFSSCSSFVEGYSDDPNLPIDVPESLLLPAAQIGTGLVYGADLAWYSSCIMQTQAGVQRQMNSASKYSIIASDVNNPWNWAYSDAMMDLKQLIDKATVNENWHYAGVAKILMAANLGTMTSIFGDMPYSEAFQGADNPTPAYDGSSDVYTTVQGLLAEAITNLGQTSGRSPGDDDLIYGGDLDAWLAAAHSLKARYYIHLAELSDANATNALSAIADGAIDRIAQNMSLAYGTADPREANPWYQFNTQRGDMRMGEELINRMVADADPRLPYYATQDAAGGYSGTNPDTPDLDASELGSYFGAIDASLAIITKSEVKFIEAEAHLRLGDNESALTFFQEAVRSSVNATTGSLDSADNYVNRCSDIPADAQNLTLEHIMKQKYIAMFTQIEGWTDLRRTGYPALTPHGSNMNMPSRLPYPQRERDFNGSNIPSNGTTLFEKLFWDVN